MTDATKVVALLRGVNIGKRRVAMVDLRSGLEAVGCRDVVTYVQSGNIILTPPTRAGHRTLLVKWLEPALSEIAGFDIPVVLRSAAELQQIVANNPFPKSSGTQLHVSFYDEPPLELLGGLDLGAFAPEQCSLIGSDLYFALPNGMGESKLPAAVTKVSTRIKANRWTVRNWNTVLKLLELSQ
jgi:uncharacterized protein (DUF1697 family)